MERPEVSIDHKRDAFRVCTPRPRRQFKQPENCAVTFSAFGRQAACIPRPSTIEALQLCHPQSAAGVEGSSTILVESRPHAEPTTERPRAANTCNSQLVIASRYVHSQAAMCRTRMHVKACSGTAGEPGSAAQSLFNISHAGFSSEAAAAEQPIAAGLNMMKGEADPPLLPDAEYPSWLWQLSEPQAMLSQLRRTDADEQSPEQVIAA